MTSGDAEPEAEEGAARAARKVTFTMQAVPHLPANDTARRRGAVSPYLAPLSEIARLYMKEGKTDWWLVARYGNAKTARAVIRQFEQGKRPLPDVECSFEMEARRADGGSRLYVRAVDL